MSTASPPFKIYITHADETVLTASTPETKIGQIIEKATENFPDLHGIPSTSLQLVYKTEEKGLVLLSREKTLAHYNINHDTILEVLTEESEDSLLRDMAKMTLSTLDTNQYITTIRPYTRIVKNPLVGTPIQKYVAQLGGKVPDEMYSGISLNGKEIPLAIQGFLESWRDGSRIFTLDGTDEMIIFPAKTVQKYPKLSDLILIGHGSYWVYAGLHDDQTNFAVFMLPSRNIVTDSDYDDDEWVGPFQITSLLKRLHGGTGFYPSRQQLVGN